MQTAGWKNDADLHPGVVDPAIYVDGAKRDRIVWAGDLTISIPSILTGTGDWNGVRYTINVFYDAQVCSFLCQQLQYRPTKRHLSIEVTRNLRYFFLQYLGRRF